MTLDQARQLLVENESCHCTTRIVLNHTTVEAKDRLTGARKALLKIWKKNEIIYVKLYLLEDAERKTIKITPHCTDRDCESRINDLYLWMHDKITG